MSRIDLRGVEVHGEDILSFMGALGSFESIGARLLQELRIGTQDARGQYRLIPGVWYPLTDKIRLLETLRERVGAATLRRVGEMIPRHARFPPSINDIHSAIRSIDTAYHMNHRRNGVLMFDEATGAMLDGIGHYGYQAVAAADVIVSVCDSPNPSEYDEGILTTMARRFQPRATIALDPDQPTRRRGAASCTFLISW